MWNLLIYRALASNVTLHRLFDIVKVVLLSLLTGQNFPLESKQILY